MFEKTNRKIIIKEIPNLKWGTVKSQNKTHEKLSNNKKLLSKFLLILGFSLIKIE